MNISTILASPRIQTVAATFSKASTAFAASPFRALIPTPAEYLTQVAICYVLRGGVQQFKRYLLTVDSETRLDEFRFYVLAHPELTPEQIGLLAQSVPSQVKETKTEFAKRCARDVVKHTAMAFAAANWSYYFWYSSPLWVGARAIGYAVQGVVYAAQWLRRKLLGGSVWQANTKAYLWRKHFVSAVDRFTIRAAWRGVTRNMGHPADDPIWKLPSLWELVPLTRRPLNTPASEPKRTVAEVTEPESPRGERMENWSLIKMGAYSEQGYRRCKQAYDTVLSELPENCEVDDPRRFGAAMATYVRNTKRSQLPEARGALPFFILMELVDGRGDESKDFTDELGLLVIDGWDEVAPPLPQQKQHSSSQ